MSTPPDDIHPAVADYLRQVSAKSKLGPPPDENTMREVRYVLEAGQFLLGAMTGERPPNPKEMMEIQIAIVRAFPNPPPAARRMLRNFTLYALAGAVLTNPVNPQQPTQTPKTGD